MTIPCRAERSVWWCCLLSDAIGEGAEQHQEGENADGGERAAPYQQPARSLKTGHRKTR
jgi:hypothetical protein